MKKNAIALRRLLALAAALALLTALFAGCGKTDPDDETLNNLDQLGTSEPAVETTEEPTAAPTEEPTEPAPTSVMGTVTTDNLNVRSNPSIDGYPLMQLAAQTRVESLEQRNVDNVMWGRITEGWIMLNYVLLDDGSNTQTPVEPETEPEAPTEPVPEKENDKTDSTEATSATITAEALNIRNGAGASFDSVGKYYKGDKVTILETKNGWGRTSKGWISMKYVETTGKAPVADDKDDEGLTTLVTDGKKTVLGYVTIDISSLNLRYGPGTKYAKKGYVKEDDRLAYYQEKNGWVRTEKGWVSLTYCDKEGTADKDDMVTDKTTKVLGYCVVTSGSLNARLGPGTNHDVLTELGLGDRVAYYQKDGNWVRTDKGWISTKYTYMEGTKGTGAGAGTVDGDKVNVRAGPGTGYKRVAKVNTGDKVDVLYQLKVGKITWGYTKDGWISMDYVKMS